MAKKPVSDQMELFEDGGFKDQGNTKDPISNNPVPVGSTKKEVRDDIPVTAVEAAAVDEYSATSSVSLEIVAPADTVIPLVVSVDIDQATFPPVTDIESS